VLSIAAAVTPSSASQAAIYCSDRQNVRKLRTVAFRSPGPPARQPHRDPDDLLVHVDPRHTRMDDIHRHLPAGPDNGYGHAAGGARSKIEIL
jgi:hypothetical protein